MHRVGTCPDASGLADADSLASQEERWPLAFSQQKQVIEIAASSLRCGIPEAQGPAESDVLPATLQAVNPSSEVGKVAGQPGKLAGTKTIRRT